MTTMNHAYKIRFTKGNLKGIEIVEYTSVERVVGKTYKACTGGFAYVVLADLGTPGHHMGVTA